MSEPSISNSSLARRALLKIDRVVLLRAVDGLNLMASAKVSPVIALPLRALQQRRDVGHFAATAPLAAVKGLLEVLSLETLDQVITLLGDHAETPTFDQLDEALARARDGGRSVDDVLAVLAFAIVESFPAAPHCRRLIEERPEFSLPELPETADGPASGVLNPKLIDPAVREQRRARREAEKGRRRARELPPGRPSRPKVSKKTAVAKVDPAPSRVPVIAESRRPPVLTPLEARRFDPGHALVGAVILADVPFSELDPSTPEVTSKERPALVIAGSSDELLVRPLYSNAGPARVLFTPWRRLGLDHPSFIEHDRVAVSLDSAPHRFGQVSIAEWNALD